MGREQYTEGAFVPSVCLDGAAVPCQARRERKRAAPAADTTARNLAPGQGKAPGAPRRPEPVQAGPDHPVRRPVVQADGETFAWVAGSVGRPAFLAAFEELRAALELRSR